MSLKACWFLLFRRRHVFLPHTGGLHLDMVVVVAVTVSAAVPSEWCFFEREREIEKVLGLESPTWAASVFVYNVSLGRFFL